MYSFCRSMYSMISRHIGVKLYSLCDVDNGLSKSPLSIHQQSHWARTCIFPEDFFVYFNFQQYFANKLLYLLHRSIVSYTLIFSTVIIWLCSGIRQNVREKMLNKVWISCSKSQLLPIATKRRTERKWNKNVPKSCVYSEGR